MSNNVILILERHIQKNQGIQKFVVDSKLQYFKPHATQIEKKTFAEEIASSLELTLNIFIPNFSMTKKALICLKKFVLFQNTILQEPRFLF